MWIEPIPRNPTINNSGPHWTNLEENEFFALQSQLNSEVYAAEASNKLSFAKPFRIILITDAFPAVFEGKQIAGHGSPSSGGDEEHKHFPVVIIALADEEKDIREHWKFLKLNVLPQMSQFDRVKEQSDLYVFVTKKISAMATEEDLANLEAPARRLRGTTLLHTLDDKEKKQDGAENDNLEGFKKLVSSVGDKSWEKEKNLLVADYECSLLVEIKRPGRLWITANNVYFLSEEQKTHVLLRIHDIIEISMKSLTQGVSDSIELSTSKSKFFFTEFPDCGPLGVEVVYNVLDSLWNAALYRIHSLSVTTLAEKENEEAELTDTDEDSDFEDMMFRDVEPDESDSDNSKRVAGNEGVPPPEDGLDRSEDSLPRVTPSKPIDVRILREELGHSSPRSSRSGSPLSLSLERLPDVEAILKNSRSDDSGKDSEDEDLFSERTARRRRSRTTTLSSSFSALSSSCNLSYYASTEINRRSSDDSPLFLPEPLNVEALLEQRKKDIFHRLFRLPLGEQLHEVLWCTFATGSDHYSGHLFVTTNYLCFHSAPIRVFGGVIDGTENYDDYGGIPIGDVTEKKKSKVSMILSLEELKPATLRVGNAKKEMLIAREEAELKKREDALHSPRRRSMAEPSSKFKSPLGNLNSPFYRSMQVLPHFEAGNHLSALNAGSGEPKSSRGSPTPEKDEIATSDSATNPASPALKHSDSEHTPSSPPPASSHKDAQPSLPSSPEVSRKVDSASSSPSAATSSTSSKAEKNVRQMLERMLTDSTEINSSGPSEDQQDLEAILKLGDAAEEGKELGTKSIRVLEKLVDRKNKEIRKLVEQRDLYKERAAKLEEHLKQLMGEEAFLAMFGVFEHPDTTVPPAATFSGGTPTTEAMVPTITEPVSAGSPMPPKLTLNEIPMTASGNVPLVAREESTEDKGNSEIATPGSKEPIVEDVKLNDVQQKSVNTQGVDEKDINEGEDVKKTEGLSGQGNCGSPTKVAEQSPSESELKEERAESIAALQGSDESREECILFRMRNDIKYIFSFEKKALSTTKLKDATGLQNLIRELCAATRSSDAVEKPPSRDGIPGIPQSMYATTSQFSADYLEKQPYRLIIWERYFAAHGSDKHMVRHSDEIATLLFCYDLPDLKRGELWNIFSCASFYLQRGKGEYANILRSYDHTESEYFEAIHQDLDRSFPGHPYFASEEGMNKIKNVLLAYSWRNPHIGYTQGMNIIVALLLCFMDEESAFWMLCCICEVLFPEYYNNGFLGLIIDQRVFLELAQSIVPEVCAIFNKRGIPLALIVAPWFMTLFISHLTLESSLHVLSQLLFGGPDSPMLFLVGLAVMKIKGRYITEHDDVNPVDMCHDIPCDELCKAVQEIEGITQQRVRALRRKHRYYVVQEMMQQSAIEPSAVEYVKPVHSHPYRRGTLSFHPTPAVTPFPTPNTTPSSTPYSTPVPHSFLLSPDVLKQVSSPPEATDKPKLELENALQEVQRKQEKEDRDQPDQDKKPQQEKPAQRGSGESLAVASPVGSPPVSSEPTTARASPQDQPKEKEPEKEREHLVPQRDREVKPKERDREREMERRARREREREKERDKERERDRAEGGGSIPRGQSRPRGARSNVSLAGLKIGQGTTTTAGPRSQPPKSPRRGKHRRYVSGVFDQQHSSAPNSEENPMVPKKKEDKTWKKEVHNLGILDVIYSIFSEPKRKEGEPRLF